MKKKLVIKFWKTERALAMQILEQEGLPNLKEKGKVWIKSHPSIYSFVQLRGSHKDSDLDVATKLFKTNQERDSHFDTITQAITDELFSGDSELKVGELCEVSNDNETWEVHPLITVLREGLLRRYIVNVSYNVKAWDCFEHARPIVKRTEPKVEVNGEIVMYTWEEE